VDLNLELFYKHFWKNIACRNVFLLHKELLLEKNSLDFGITDYYLQRIVLSNSITSKKQVDKDLEFRKNNRFTAVLKQIEKSKDKYFNEEKIEEFINKKFGKAINEVIKITEEGDIVDLGLQIYSAIKDETGEELVELLRRVHLLPSGIDNLDELEKYIEYQILRETKAFLKKQNFSHMFLSVDDISQFYNSVLKESLINGYQQNINILIDKDNYRSRLKLFDRLYEIKIIEGGKFKSYFECINCSPGTFSGFIDCDITPSKLKIKCPQCNKVSSYLAPYFITDELFKHITHKDGLIFFAIRYLLDLKRIDYSSSFTYEDCNEIDFVIKENKQPILFLEVKMFRNDKNKSVKTKNIQESINQIKKNRKKLLLVEEENIAIPYFLVTNIEDRTILKKAKSSLKKDLKEFNIEIFTPSTFYDFLEEEFT